MPTVPSPWCRRSDIWPVVDRQFANGAFHWFLLAQPGDLPERLLAGDPDAFLDAALDRMSGGIEKLHPRAVEAYREAFREASVRHAIIEDYRSAYGIDVDHRPLVRHREQPAQAR